MARSSLLALLVVALAGCAPPSVKGAAADAAPEVTSMEPAEIKANFDGSVALEGNGFYGSTFQANFQPITSMNGATLVVEDDHHARIDFHYGGSGHEIDPGNYQITLTNSFGQTNAPTVLHVKTFLAKVEWVRTLALPFTKTAGTVKLYVRPEDFRGQILYPGHPLVGTNGVLAGDFSYATQQVTAVGSTTALPLPDAAIGGDDFQFLGEGSGQPMAISIAIDQSGSMHGQDGNPASDPNDERVTQAESFVQQLGASDVASVYAFQGTSVTKVIDFTSDKTALVAALETLRSGVGGATPLWDAMSTTVAAAAAEPTSYVRATVVLTDGRDTDSTATPSSVIAAAQSANVPVFSIGLGNPNVPNSLDTANLQVIADQTGGKLFLAADPSALSGVFGALEGTLDSSYEVTANVTFATPLPANGAYAITSQLSTTIDGETVTIDVPAFTISALN